MSKPKRISLVRTAFLAPLALFGLAAACSRSPYAPTQCSDGADNDGDGRIDMDDPGCTDPGDDDERGPGGTDADADDGETEAEVETEADGEAEADAPCTAGCWSGTACEPGTETAACGTGGADCMSCDDGRSCTVDVCTPAGCTHEPAADDSVCTEAPGGRCVDGTCAIVRIGTAAFDLFGTAVALVPDVDGDDVPDCLIGAPGAASYNGRVWLFSGTAAVETATWTGSATEAVGTSVCGGEDVDGNGHEDLGFGGPDAEIGGNAYAGLAMFVAGGPTLGTPVELDGTATYDRLGTALDFGPHFGGTGTGAQIAVGAPGCEDAGGPENTGCVLLFDGATRAWRATVFGTETAAQFGFAVALGPDLDAVPDGLGDLLVGEPHSSLPDLPGGRGSAGRVQLISSRNGAPAWTLDGPVVGGRLGSAVALGPDLTGDGRDDAVVGAPGYVGEKGAVWVLDGVSGETAWALDPAMGTEAGGLFGTAVSLGPDANSDGVPDVAVGAPGETGGTGRVYLLSGTDGSPIRVFSPGALGELFGGAVSLGPDIDGDGLADLLAGAAMAAVDPRGDGVGRVYLFLSSGW